MTRKLRSIIPSALAVLLAWPAAAVTQAGVTAAVRGQVDLVAVIDKAKHRAKSGEDVFLGDGISSLDESGMQLMLLDETVFTIGPNTDMTVDEFVYDPATGAGQVTVSLAKGVLRFVTGKVAQGAPEDMVVNLPVGTIGIRGTIGAASYDGTTALVVLLGPGASNNAGERAGRLDVTAAGQTVGLTRPRFGTIIELGQPPSPPFQLTDVQIGAILGALGSPPSEQEPADAPKSGTATSLAEQDTVELAEFVEPEDAISLDDVFDSSSLVLPVALFCSPCVDASTGGFSDVIFQGNVFTFTLFDSETLDNDIVNFEVLSASCSGDCSGSNINLNTSNVFTATVSSGLGNLKIDGVSTGTIDSLTLGVTIDNVISGSSTQSLSLGVGNDIARLKFEAGSAPGS